MKNLTLSDFVKFAKQTETTKQVNFDSLTIEDKINYMESITALDSLTYTKTYEKKSNGLTAAEKQATIAAITAKMIADPANVPAYIQELNEVNAASTKSDNESKVKVTRTYSYSELTTSNDKLAALKLANSDVDKDTKVSVPVFAGENVLNLVAEICALGVDGFTALVDPQTVEGEITTEPTTEEPAEK